MPKQPSDKQLKVCKCVSEKLIYKFTNLQIYKPYLDIILFAITLLVANWVWKLMVSGDEFGHGDVTWFGLVVTPFFDAIAAHTARCAYWVVDVFRDTVHLSDIRIWFDSGNGTSIVWGCTPVKQSFIWLCLIATAIGPWMHKLWFIPAGWVLIYIINILRIVFISLIIEFHPELFDLMHTYIFKYAFYGIMFLMWLVWTYMAKIFTEQKS